MLLSLVSVEVPLLENWTFCILLNQWRDNQRPYIKVFSDNSSVIWRVIIVQQPLTTLFIYEYYLLFLMFIFDYNSKYTVDIMMRAIIKNVIENP